MRRHYCTAQGCTARPTHIHADSTGTLYLCTIHARRKDAR